MTPRQRMHLAVTIAVLSLAFMIIPLFPRSYLIGCALIGVHHAVRSPFHSRNPKDYPRWFGYIILAPLIFIAGFFFGPPEFKPLLQLAISLSIGAMMGATSYLDGERLKRKPSAEPPAGANDRGGRGSA